MTLRLRLLRWNDRLLGALVALLLTGSSVAFGGRVWWAPPALAIACGALTASCLLRILLEGRMRLLKSPLGLLGLMAIGVGVAQLAPLPASLSSKLSPNSRAAYAVGFLPERARSLDPSVELPEPPEIRSPVSLDRGATLRWLAGATACLSVFWVSSQYADRVGHLFLIWGSLLAGFFLNTALVLVQVASGSRALFGGVLSGRGPFWSPNLNDLAAGPNMVWLRAGGPASPAHPAWAVVVADRPFTPGTLMGGPEAYLAFASLGLPLTLAMLLQLMAPRGSREPLGQRLSQGGHGGLAVLLGVMLAIGALLTGLLAGPIFAVPFAVGVLAVGVPSARATGLRWWALGLSLMAVGLIGLGAVLGSVWAGLAAFPPPVMPRDMSRVLRVWTDALPMLGDFPILGIGVGTFSAVFPFYKSVDAASTTALSSLLQWWVETGVVGLSLLAVGGLWCLVRLPYAIRNVGTADRALVFGLIGAGLGFTLVSAVHWTVELTSVALAASAVGGTCNRWLAGATDLFVERI